MLAYGSAKCLQHEADVVHPSLQEAVLNTCPMQQALVQRDTLAQWMPASRSRSEKGACTSGFGLHDTDA